MKRIAQLSLILFTLIGCGDEEASNNGAGNNVVNNGANNGAWLCGNGVVDAAETCDSGITDDEGACVITCEPSSACMEATLEGTAASCTAECVEVAKTTPECVECTPGTCAEASAQCGAVSDGCGGMLECGMCGNDEVCTDNTCVPVGHPAGTVGGACDSDPDCVRAGDDYRCLEAPAFPGGYCIRIYTPVSTACAAGQACVELDHPSSSGDIPACAWGCEMNEDCREGYSCLPQPKCFDTSVMVNACVPTP